ncbi:MAG: RrF2 family transcriptional regulator [Syntrophobacteraceae bacterium]
MKLSTRSRYGVRFLLDLALHAGEGPVQLGAVARRQGIDVKYLEQIAMPLKKANYVTGVRGAKGGHRLGRPPEEITVAGVVTLLEGGLKLTNCIGSAGACERSEQCVTRTVWAEATRAVFEHLEAVSLRDLMNRVPGAGGPEECGAQQQEK